MKKQTAGEILELDSDYSLRENYSGRFMYGKETYAVVVPSRADVGFLKKKYDGLKSDNMGKDYIVY